MAELFYDIIWYFNFESLFFTKFPFIRPDREPKPRIPDPTYKEVTELYLDPMKSFGTVKNPDLNAQHC